MWSSTYSMVSDETSSESRKRVYGAWLPTPRAHPSEGGVRRPTAFGFAVGHRASVLESALRGPGGIVHEEGTSRSGN
jgi:hypothetical protein